MKCALLALALVAGCGSSDMPSAWTSDPFGPLLTLAEREGEGSCYAPPGDPSGCTPDLTTGACVPSAASACSVTASDPRCVRCAKTQCCSPVLACSSAGEGCACLVEARTDGTPPSCSAGAAAEAAAHAEAACLAQRCAAACPAFARDGGAS